MNRKKRDGYEVMGKKNIQFAFDYLLEATKNPEILKIIPKNAHVIFIPRKKQWLQNKNFQLAKDIIKRGEKLVLLPV